MSVMEWHWAGAAALLFVLLLVLWLRADNKICALEKEIWERKRLAEGWKRGSHGLLWPPASPTWTCDPTAIVSEPRGGQVPKQPLPDPLKKPTQRRKA